MRALMRIAVVMVLLSSGSGLYACSGDSGDSGNIADAKDGATPNAGEAGVGAQVDAGTPPPPGATCAILEANTGHQPVLEPAACQACAAEKCCAPLTKCYGGAPADADLDGSNGQKTSCQLLVECQDACNGDVPCEDQCGVTYGESADNDWAAVEDCLAAPSGCVEVCGN
jgi:hypothetical protein